MNLKQQRAAAIKAAQDIITKAQEAGRGLTDEELTQVKSYRDKIEDLTAQIAEQEKSDALVAQITGMSPDTGVSGAKADDYGDDVDGTGMDQARSFGERFTKSGAYQAFMKANPSGVGQGSLVDIGKVKVGTLDEWYSRQVQSKTGGVIGTPTARIAPARYPTVNMVDRDQLTLLDLITRGSAAGAFEYLQIISVTRNAKIVPEATSIDDDAALKPLSEFATQLADAKPYTYADGYVVTNQLLSDAPALATYLNTEVGYSLEAVIVDKLLNGTGENGEPRGILNTTGVQEVEFTATEGDVMPLVKAVRRGITQVTRLPGGRVTAILLNPEDDEAIDMLQDANDRFYGGGPYGTTVPTLWGRPRLADDSIQPGQFLLGDLKQVALLDVEGLSILAFNQHRDFAQRNLTYVRAEKRAEQVIWKPSRLVHGGNTAG